MHFQFALLCVCLRDVSFLSFSCDISFHFLVFLKPPSVVFGVSCCGVTWNNLKYCRHKDNTEVRASLAQLLFPFSILPHKKVKLSDSLMLQLLINTFNFILWQHTSATATQNYQLSFRMELKVKKGNKSAFPNLVQFSLSISWQQKHLLKPNPKWFRGESPTREEPGSATRGRRWWRQLGDGLFAFLGITPLPQACFPSAGHGFALP